MARLLKSKGITEYIKAEEMIKNKYPEVEFKILGSPGSDPDAVDMEYVNQAVKDGVIVYPRRVDDVKSYIAQSSVYVLPSYYREETIMFLSPSKRFPKVFCSDLNYAS